jgi:hypothetical protein
MNAATSECLPIVACVLREVFDICRDFFAYDTFGQSVSSSRSDGCFDPFGGGDLAAGERRWSLNASVAALRVHGSGSES